jgi:hypothetical protein
MIPVVIFYLHIVGAVTAFTNSWQKHGLSDGLLTLGFIGLIFAVGWTIMSMLVRYIAPQGIGAVLDKDALPLMLLTVAEGIFHYFYYKGK